MYDTTWSLYLCRQLSQQFILVNVLSWRAIEPWEAAYARPFAGRRFAGALTLGQLQHSLLMVAIRSMQRAASPAHPALKIITKTGFNFYSFGIVVSALGDYSVGP